ncbi:WhiB family transcriptional regulator [Streptomyces paludis]|uniref:WhiB family transcriptional regulator n=1 Tax=Streptomyces paludis TaxID=2282738 RepID=UPI0015F2BFAA|nr:WhiB family transcriptional regulator [Streptomyces paludis]
MAPVAIGEEVLFDPTRRWVSRASCRTVSSARFFVDGPAFPRIPPSAAQQAGWDLAKKICHHCPVLAECRRDSLGEEYGVWGGLDERERYLIRTRLSQRARRWPAARRLAWGKELLALRDGGNTWTRIRAMTGIGDRLGELLIDEWVTHRALTAQPPAAVVELPLPAPGGMIQPPFPAVPGRRHAWVRRAGRITDAHYRGQTEDGAWISVQLRTGKGNSIQFVRSEDVQIYHPQPVVIVTYIGRPDREQQSQAG